MKRVIKFDNLLSPINQKKIDDLCKSISENCEGPLGWEQLTKLSGFTHKELIALFHVYKQTTPMAFIKHARQLRKIDSPVFPQNQLFPKFIKNTDTTG
jgi:transcriptional regulator GlxA family with amidase domain